jgi:hypothetical protein
LILIDSKAQNTAMKTRTFLPIVAVLFAAFALPS